MDDHEKTGLKGIACSRCDAHGGIMDEEDDERWLDAACPVCDVPEGRLVCRDCGKAQAA